MTDAPAPEGSFPRCAVHHLALGPRGRCVLCLRPGDARAMPAPVRGERAWSLGDWLSVLVTGSLALGFAGFCALTAAVLMWPIVSSALQPSWAKPRVVITLPTPPAKAPPVHAAPAEPTVPEASTALPTGTQPEPRPGATVAGSRPAPDPRVVAERARAEEEAARDRARSEMVTRMIQERDAARERRRVRQTLDAAGTSPVPPASEPTLRPVLGGSGEDTGPTRPVQWRFASGMRSSSVPEAPNVPSGASQSVSSTMRPSFGRSSAR